MQFRRLGVYYFCTKNIDMLTLACSQSIGLEFDKIMKNNCCDLLHRSFFICTFVALHGTNAVLICYEAYFFTPAEAAHDLCAEIF